LKRIDQLVSGTKRAQFKLKLQTYKPLARVSEVYFDMTSFSPDGVLRKDTSLGTILYALHISSVYHLNLIFKGMW